MLLTVNGAAERLNVSPHTVRRWTSTGFLRCTRTAGGHRRIEERDVEEAAALISEGSASTAQLAKERELETFVRTSLAIARQLDVKDLLVEVAEQMTNLLEGDFCRVSAYDEATRSVEILSDYSRTRSSRPFQSYPASVFPVVEQVLSSQTPHVTNASEPDADVDDLRIMKRDGDKSLLVLPMLYKDSSVGLIEVMDQKRERHYSPRELRFAMALAEQAAVALNNAKAFGELRRNDEEAKRLHGAVADMPASVEELMRQPDIAAVLDTLTRLAGDACGGLLSVAAFGGQTVGAAQTGPSAGGVTEQAVHQVRADTAQVVTSTAVVGDTALTLTVSLSREDGDTFAVLLDFLTTAAAVALHALELR